MNQEGLLHKINQAAQVVGKTWPLYSFVTANPLSGYEQLSFLEAIREAGELLNANLLPEPFMFRQAWEAKKIDPEHIQSKLRKAGFYQSAQQSLLEMEAHANAQSAMEQINEYHDLDRLTVKWLSLFLDEGMAPWPMPFKEMGFYTAWRKLIVFDNEIKKKNKRKIPKTPVEALTFVLEGFDENQQIEVLKRHLSSLPGWVGFIKFRMENNSIWNKEFPVSLLDYLAVRLWMAYSLDAPILPKLPPIDKTSNLITLKYLWLEAWESTWQDNFERRIKESLEKSINCQKVKPIAQLVFCLDTRSELLRRTLEQLGNYETFGSAGAFGLPMDYCHPENGLVNKSSPAMVPSKYMVHERPMANNEAKAKGYIKEGKQIGAYKYFLKRLKNILPSAFGFVEGAGLYYGGFMLMRLFKPNAAERLTIKHHKGCEHIYEPHISRIHKSDSRADIPLEEKAALVKGVFDSCGWRDFAPLIVFTGHASHSANNPFASSLDCGACAGNPGKRNARMLAKLANCSSVRQLLKEKYGIYIPNETIFIAAEHITSSDEVILFDQNIPESHQDLIQQLKRDLSELKKSMTKTRLNEPQNAVSLAKIKSNSWSESRPEWGLSGHAGYIIGPRALTSNGTFNDCFMSSYDWKIDKDGSILKAIMQGPLVVVQWISNHYYFSTVDNNILGGGSKITLNITGKHGAMQGNGSDLKMGLPLQSVMVTDKRFYHNPIRISILIQAPKHFVDSILVEDSKLSALINNGWILLHIMDPEKENKIEKYPNTSKIKFEEGA